MDWGFLVRGVDNDIVGAFVRVRGSRLHPSKMVWYWQWRMRAKRRSYRLDVSRQLSPSPKHGCVAGAEVARCLILCAVNCHAVYDTNEHLIVADAVDRKIFQNENRLLNSPFQHRQPGFSVPKLLQRFPLHPRQEALILLHVRS